MRAERAFSLVVMVVVVVVVVLVVVLVAVVVCGPALRFFCYCALCCAL